MTDVASTNIPKKSMLGVSVPYEVLRLISEDVARHYGFVPLSITDGILEIGLKDVEDVEARDSASFIANKLGLPYKFFLLTEADYNQVLGEYTALPSEVGRVLSDLNIKELAEKNAPLKKKGLLSGVTGEGEKETPKDDEPKELVEAVEAATPGGSVHLTEEAPVSKIVAVIIQHATEGNASDVHIEPIGEKVRVRFRVDGILYTSLLLPIKVYDAIVARVKILTNMKLDEKRKPQDGRFSAKIAGRRIDFRVSTFPVYFGEKVVIRILNPEVGLRKLDAIGLTSRNLETIKKAIKQPYGLILLTGPTGSGKTTTLYSMLNELDHETGNILSLEDPIEYNIAGINQSQVRPEIEYTFATGLRSILRQDPDVIMVGEIRDRETAQLAIQAALTGHLVFSTLHTNNSIGVIPRLIDMGIDPYLIAPTLILAIAQRLVRVLCPEGKEAMQIEGTGIRTMIDKMFQDLPAEFRKDVVIPKEIYRAIPSPTCSSGTRGRVAVFEMLPVDKGLQSIILKSPNEVDLYKYARERGFMSMKEDALLKAFRGEVPFEEVNRL